MNYEQSLEYIHSLNKFGKKAGLDNIRALLELMGNPQDKLKFVHIAGTNGKGSTTSMIASVLKQSGLNVGKYISPFVLEFGERMQFNDKMITHDELADVTNFVKCFADQLASEGRGPVEFEVVTAIAFEFFARKNCDIVALEVGLGGRYDSTNVIAPPLASVTTTIGYDHVAILGDTLSKIAMEKCGIIKNPAPVVCYVDQNKEALDVIKSEAYNAGCTFVIGDINELSVKFSSIEGTSIVYKGISISIPLGGYHQIYNAITAVETLLLLRDKYRYNISNDDIANGIAAVRFPARMEILQKNPTVILDGAHNQSGIDALVKSLEDVKARKINLIIGMLADKDFSDSLLALCKIPQNIFTVTPPSPRAMDSHELAAKIKAAGINAVAFDNLEEAYKSALSKTIKDDILVICGSLYLATDMRQIVLKHSG